MRGLLPVLLAACGAPTGEPALDTGPAGPWDGWFDSGGYVAPDTTALVFRRFEIPAAQGGVAPGFDLDGRTSDADDDATCGHADLVDDAGRPGIDNQLAAMWSLAEPIVGEAVEGLLQGSINEGRMLLMVELDGLGEGLDGDDVTLRLFRGAILTPQVGARGLLAPHQTFAVDDSVPVVEVSGVSVVDGVLEAGPITFTLPIDILEANFLMAVQGGRIRLTLSPDGSARGVIGGSVHVETMLDELLATDAAEEAAAVAPFFENNTDLEPDGGDCTRMSVAFPFEAAPAFVVRYGPPAP